MGKLKPRRIPSDDCAVTFDGETYYPHEGEWVEVVPGLSVGELHAYRVLQEMGPQLAAAAGDDNEDVQRVRLVDDAFETLLPALSRRVTDWNWTDGLGQPMPKPKPGDPEPLRLLGEHELVWLIGAVMGRSAAAEGKGSKPSPTTSSGSGRRPRRTR